MSMKCFSKTKRVKWSLLTTSGDICKTYDFKCYTKSDIVKHPRFSKILFERKFITYPDYPHGSILCKSKRDDPIQNV